MVVGAPWVIHAAQGTVGVLASNRYLCYIWAQQPQPLSAYLTNSGIIQQMVKKTFFLKVGMIERKILDGRVDQEKD